uniref:Uncharacterized protein n=1 Tax=Timema cristinae TaxID=61476 RepID=A0A7R9DEV5_TIMCR|nr:unnamed protein product [Timema cristinae]
MDLVVMWSAVARLEIDSVEYPPYMAVGRVESEGLYPVITECTCVGLVSKVPLIIPVVVLVISVYLIVAPIIDKPQIEYLYAAFFIVAGLVLYVPFVHYGVVPAFMGTYLPVSVVALVLYVSSLDGQLHGVLSDVTGSGSDSVNV